MVKIRLRRLGNKARPFYRVVVAKSTAGRNGAFVEILGTYSAIEQPKRIEIEAERALYWLRQGAEPTETVAYLLNKVGVLETYLNERPNQRQKYKFLDKRTKPSQATTNEAAPTDAPALAETSEDEATV
ncbi:30S ribosomal protein S16 [bacterium]|nr:MAG: 30S ribosomal protein S16 [bacterium]